MIQHLNEIFHDFKDRELKRRGLEDLQPCHGNLLGILKRYKGRLQMKDVPLKLNRTKSTVTNLVKNLEKKGYIAKDPCEQDGRCSYIELSEKGYGVCDAFEQITDKLERHLWKDYSEEELIFFIMLLKKLIRNIESAD